MQEITSKAVILLINSFAVIVKMEVGSFMILDDFSYVIFEVPGWHFLRGSMHFFISMFLDNFHGIFCTLQPNNAPKTVLSGEAPGGFCDVSCCYSTSLEASHFDATFLCH